MFYVEPRKVHMFPKRVDSNQKQIVQSLRKLGFSVAITSMVGKGFPDIVVGRHGVNYLFELKDGNKPASCQKLTLWEADFFATWKGKVEVATCLDDILKSFNAHKL